ncbi:MAG: hypothetical protein ACSW8C_01895 [bacterium]
MSGYTLLEVMLTISISAFLLFICYGILQKQQKKPSFNKNNISAKRECLDFFTQVAPFTVISTKFTPQNATTIALELLPPNENGAQRHFTIQLNGKFGNKDTLNIATHHIQNFSWAYWDSQRRKWQGLKNGTTYSGLNFLKVILWGKNKKVLDTFIFSCDLSNP